MSSWVSPLASPSVVSPSDGQGPAQTPPCRVCGSAEWVACYREDRPEAAICVNCCEGAEHDDGTGHVWTYDRAERDRVCDHCGQFAANTDYYEGADYD